MPPEEEGKVPTIIEALARVMDEVQSIGKDQTNTVQNYAFRGIDAVVNAVGPAFRKHGVVCVPVDVGYDAEHYTTKNNAQMRGVTMRVLFRFYGPAGDFIDAMALGEAADAGDKAIPKAHSVAYRTLLLQALCIPTGDPDPDASSVERAVRKEEPPGYPVPTSWPKVEAGAVQCDNPDESKALYEAFLRAATYHTFGQTSLKDISTEDRRTMLQKASGAVCWLHDTDAGREGPFSFFREDEWRAAWASVIDGVRLEVPDYEPPPAPEEEPTPVAEEASL